MDGIFETRSKEVPKELTGDFGTILWQNFMSSVYKREPFSLNNFSHLGGEKHLDLEKIFSDSYGERLEDSIKVYDPTKCGLLTDSHVPEDSLESLMLYCTLTAGSEATNNPLFLLYMKAVACDNVKEFNHYEQLLDKFWNLLNDKHLSKDMIYNIFLNLGKLFTKLKFVVYFANCCPDKQAKTAKVKAVSELDEEIGFLLGVSAVADSSNLDDDEGECRRRWTAEIQVNGKQVKFKLDSQADVTCVPLCLFKTIMGQQRLVESNINLRAAEFSELQTVGMFVSTLRNGSYEIKERIYVIRRLSEPLLSRRACELLNLARRIEVVATKINPIKEFPEVFEGLGQIGSPCEIKLKPGANPCAVHTPRRVPNFARQYGFTHVASSPRFPQSNGMAEAGVKIAKLVLKKNQDPSLGVLECRLTPLENGCSPAELLMGPELRTTLPIAPENLNPRLVDSQTLKRKEERRRRDMKSRYDRRCRARDMEELVKNEKTPAVDYPSSDSDDGQIRTRSGRIVKPVDRLHC
ncbi:K02A2.6-like [Cordylochernes scorpioides]|uniref:K02A2.6-like n=1 Tax=Cordylochernes scorpioides TaxID=51811 RepID=A0ABY6LAE0_9ARAC|nr:K02A2.6-like [Cordylochernes scorpioides]